MIALHARTKICAMNGLGIKTEKRSIIRFHHIEWYGGYANMFNRYRWFTFS